jgi:hypothetical protein
MRIATGASMVGKHWLLGLLRYLLGKILQCSSEHQSCDIITQRNCIYFFYTKKVQTSITYLRWLVWFCAPEWFAEPFPSLSPPSSLVALVCAHFEEFLSEKKEHDFLNYFIRVSQRGRRLKICYAINQRSVRYSGDIILRNSEVNKTKVWNFPWKIKIMKLSSHAVL